jgi:Spy/CpxP family protein refolding chaperone
MKIISILLSAAIAIHSFAQQSISPPPPIPPAPPSLTSQKEKVEAMRIAFLTNKLDLTPEEAQKFWPVYNEFQKKREELHKKHREEEKQMRSKIDSLSDKQVEAMVDAEMAFRQKNLDLEKEYHAKFKSVLPIKKVAKLYRAEEQFARHLLERLSESRMGPKPLREGKKRIMPPVPTHEQDED